MVRRHWTKSYPLLVLATQFLLSIARLAPGQTTPTEFEIFAPNRMVAWCIVPFDAKKRGPDARAEMVKQLGMRRIAYDWRDEHVSTFEQEILAYQKHGIEFFAFWSWHDAIEPLLHKYDLHPQLWITNPSPDVPTQTERIAAAVRELAPMVERAQRLGCQLGLYNHGGWGGEVENLVAVCQALRSQEGTVELGPSTSDGGIATSVPLAGIVYNFHHGHGDIADFEKKFSLLLPYLLCVNLNGMANPEQVRGTENKIISVGEGKHEGNMIRTIAESGYRGPVGIIDHRETWDAERSLRENLSGLKEIIRQLSTAQKSP